MEDLSKNTTQQKSKTKLKLALLIVWMTICTAIFLYITSVVIKLLAEDFDTLSSYQSAINILNIIFFIALYASFIILAIPYLVKLIRSLRVEHRSDIPPQ